MHCFTTSISHGVEKYFPRLWGTGISDAIFYQTEVILSLHVWIVEVLVYWDCHMTGLLCGHTCVMRGQFDLVTFKLTQ